MKLQFSPVIALGMIAVTLTSCVEKVQVCKLDHENFNGAPYLQYHYDGDKLIQADVFALDSTEANYKYIWTYNNGVITNVDLYYGPGDTLSHSNVVFITNGKIDSVQTWFDSNGDNIGIGDFFNATYIYHYTGDKITTIDRRFDGSPVELYATWEWTGNNVTKATYASNGNYFIYTHSGIKNTYYEYIYVENMVSDPAPALMSEYLASNQKRYDSLDVLINNVDFTITEIENGVQIYYPGTGNTRQFLKSCVEQ